MICIYVYNVLELITILALMGNVVVQNRKYLNYCVISMIWEHWDECLVIILGEIRKITMMIQSAATSRTVV